MIDACIHISLGWTNQPVQKFSHLYLPFYKQIKAIFRELLKVLIFKVSKMGTSLGL